MNFDAIKTPPNSLDAELAVLGAVAEIPDAWSRVCSLLQPEDFYRPAHRKVFEYAIKLDAANEPVDGRTLCDYAHRDGRDDVALAVGEASVSFASAHNLEHYAKVIRERKLERDLIAASVKIGDLGFENLPTAEKLDRAQALVMGLAMEHRSESARAVREVLVSVVAELERRMASKGRIQGLATGFADLDARWSGLKPGNLVVIAGRPAMGKTTLAMNIAAHNALAGKRVLVFSLEMSAEELVERTIASQAGIAHEDIRTGRVLSDSEFAPAVSKLRDLDLIIDDAAGVDLAKIRSRVRLASVKKPVDLVVVDHLQLMNGEGRTQNELVGGITKGLKNLAKELRCPVLLLSQLNREVDKRPYGKNRPVMSDLRDSGSIEQDSDIVAFVYRNVVYKPNSAYSNVAEVITAKFRNGVPGTTYLREDFQHCRFQSYAGSRPNYDTYSNADSGFDPERF